MGAGKAGAGMLAMAFPSRPPGLVQKGKYQTCVPDNSDDVTQRKKQDHPRSLIRRERSKMVPEMQHQPADQE